MYYNLILNNNFKAENLMKELLKFLAPYKKECILGPFFKLLEAILELLLPTVMVLVINSGVLQKNTSYVLKMGVMMILMSLLGFGCSLICQYSAAKASQGYGTDLRNALFKHISSFSYAELDYFGASTLTTRLTNDINQLQLAVAMLIRLVVRAPFICIGAIIMAMFLNFRLSLILIAASPLFIVVLYFIISKSSRLYKSCQQKLDDLSTIIRENLTGVRVIRAFAKHHHEADRFNYANDDLTAVYNLVAKFSALLSPATSLIMNMAIVVILWAGGIQINAGNFTQGEMIAYINYITQVLLALIVVSNLIIIFTKASASAQRVSEVLCMRPSITSLQRDSDDLCMSLDVPLIEFRNVSFSYYNTADKAVEDISFSIYAGQTIGVIGATGSGKTTLVNLIGRFYEVTSGSIKVNNYDIKSYALTTLRKIIGYVPQKSDLIKGTISENLKLGNEKSTSEAIQQACVIAQADSFIRQLPEGYSSQVERGGQNFSGGQRQRLAIARALVSEPHLLILDDSASALDFATESQLRKALKEGLESMTIITISQRASSIHHCDQILVMDDGRIVGQGTHDELLVNCPVYYEICLSQMSRDEAHQGGLL
ncbi:MAG: ATP-binding protein [Clostridia bacterium]|nr:ATP-binding protein [Clostridia bacterium]